MAPCAGAAGEMGALALNGIWNLKPAAFKAVAVLAGSGFELGGAEVPSEFFLSAAWFGGEGGGGVRACWLA